MNYKQAFQSFSVDNIKKAKEFYEETLGLKVEEKYGGLQVHTKDNEPIMLYQKDNHEPATYTTLNFLVEDIEKTVDDLAEKGIKFEQYPDMDTNKKGISTQDNGPSMAWFKDSAGNVIGLMQM